MGGIVIAITLIIGTIILYNTNKELLPLTLIVIGFGVVGFVDDFKKLILRDTEGLKPAYKILRTSCDFCNICFIFNKNRSRNRYNNSRIKNRNSNTNITLHTILNFCNVGSNKCGKFNRWDRWPSEHLYL